VWCQGGNLVFDTACVQQHDVQRWFGVENQKGRSPRLVVNVITTVSLGERITADSPLRATHQHEQGTNSERAFIPPPSSPTTITGSSNSNSSSTASARCKKIASVAPR